MILDEYFSGEPVNDVTQFYSFDSLPQSGASTNDLTEIPPSPPASPPLAQNSPKAHQLEDEPGKST